MQPYEIKERLRSYIEKRLGYSSRDPMPVSITLIPGCEVGEYCDFLFSLGTHKWYQTILLNHPYPLETVFEKCLQRMKLELSDMLLRRAEIYLDLVKRMQEV